MLRALKDHIMRVTGCVIGADGNLLFTPRTKKMWAWIPPSSSVHEGAQVVPLRVDIPEGFRFVEIVDGIVAIVFKVRDNAV